MHAPLLRRTAQPASPVDTAPSPPQRQPQGPQRVGTSFIGYVPSLSHSLGGGALPRPRGSRRGLIPNTDHFASNYCANPSAEVRYVQHGDRRRGRSLPERHAVNARPITGELVFGEVLVLTAGHPPTEAQGHCCPCRCSTSPSLRVGGRRLLIGKPRLAGRRPPTRLRRGQVGGSLDDWRSVDGGGVSYPPNPGILVIADRRALTRGGLECPTTYSNMSVVPSTRRTKDCRLQRGAR